MEIDLTPKAALKKVTLRIIGFIGFEEFVPNCEILEPWHKKLRNTLRKIILKMIK
ncbi:MAG: hypothetical protein ACTSO9_06815 [Candidatus Helarchaeota archaeon]